ncbi:hypothetical protein LTR74_002489 [Friedmanniomyces endolithicus]|nr:hypothetical protein LTR74_002489 [Friedmanniomyces endolithicus]
MAKHRNPPLRQSVIPTLFDYPSAQTLLPTVTQKRGKSGTQRAHEKHQHDLNAARTLPTASPSLADRFHALPSELRTHIFSLLLVRPAKWDVLHGPSCELPMSEFGIMPHPRWHEEAGEAFYRGNTFCFEATDALAGFVANTRLQWCRAVTRVSLMAWSTGPDLSDREDYDWEGVETLEPRTTSLLRRALPNLAHIELDARCLADMKSVRALLRVGLMQRRVAIHFVLPARKRRAIFGTEGGTEYPWPRLANRVLLRGGFPEEVARAMKGERRAWMKAGGRKAGRSAVEAACEGFRDVLAAVEGERLVGRDGGKG